MRPIDGDALKANVLKWLPPDPCGREEYEYPVETDICVSMLQEIDKAPTIDVVAVVRCKDCAYHDEVDEYELWCMGNGYPGRLVTPDEFCSKGAPK